MVLNLLTAHLMIMSRYQESGCREITNIRGYASFPTIPFIYKSMYYFTLPFYSVNKYYFGLYTIHYDSS